MKKVVQMLLVAGATLAAFGCHKEEPAVRQAQANVDVVKEQADEAKNRAEKRTEIAKDDLDKRLEATKEAANRRVDEAKARADEIKENVKQEVRGVDDDYVGPEVARWRAHWNDYVAKNDAKWDTNDDWLVERRENGEFRAHRRIDDIRTAKVDDDTLEKTVKWRFGATKDINANQIRVEARDGVITLTGSVGSNDAAGEAMRLALGTRGVRQVIARLSVQ